VSSGRKPLVIEGWRSSSHSYALVNQHQLLHLMDDARFDLSHLDVPFYRAQWARLDAGLPEPARTRLAQLPAPSPKRAHAIYRISWPLRVHAGMADRVFVFGTCELGQLPPDSFCGPAMTAAGVDKRAVDIITPSQWSRLGFLSEGFDESRIHVLPHGAEPAEFTPLSVEERRNRRATLGIHADALVFLNIGAMTWNKGIAPLLGAFAQYRLQDERAVLLLKGSEALYGDQVSAAAQEAVQTFPLLKDPKVHAAIRYVPHNLSRSELTRLYQVSDAYVSPYRAEGFNLPVLEALAAGLPVLVTAGGATDDFCPEHLCLRIAAKGLSTTIGRYLEPAVDSIVDCMAKVANDSALRTRAARQAPEWVAERYSWTRITRQLGDLIAAS
jgi:glycosyltransferase involved in cell wall biosynthesis